MSTLQKCWRLFLVLCGTVAAVIFWNFLILANVMSWLFGDAFPKAAFWIIVGVSVPVFAAIAYRYFFVVQPSHTR